MTRSLPAGKEELHHEANAFHHLWLGSYGTEVFGEEHYPSQAAVIMQYTGLSEVTGDEPPTYNCVGTGCFFCLSYTKNIWKKISNRY